jgi:hypothetical protein
MNATEVENALTRAGARIAPRASSAWIDTEGRFYFVPDCQHETVAADTFETDATGLEQRGWLHLSFGQIRHAVRALTVGQTDTLFAVRDAFRAAMAEGNQVCAGTSFEDTFRALIPDAPTYADMATVGALDSEAYASLRAY